jgi:arylsulfatase A-like enzyme
MCLHVLLFLAAAAIVPAAAKGPKMILSVIIDDMGWYDSQPHNPTAPTPTLGEWAKEGILVERQCALMSRSPASIYTRRCG